MKKYMLVAIALTALASAPVFAHCGKCGAGHAAAAATGDIVAVASSAGDFSTLVKAVQVAGLVETLQSDGPFTVFAPTDEAFNKLPAGALESLLADPDQL
jgi:uncharacterized surface protein with fasciclin (FAS1) repeats